VYLGMAASPFGCPLMPGCPCWMIGTPAEHRSTSYCESTIIGRNHNVCLTFVLECFSWTP
jgi:hypothetical protein